MAIIACTFYRNFASYAAGALNVIDVWPLQSVVDGTDFIHNDALLIEQDSMNWAVPVRTLRLSILRPI